MSLCKVECFNKIKNGSLRCNCDEENIQYHWNWKSSAHNVVMSEDKFITFHPVYSSGTAAIRGDKPFLPNNHYYWEIKLCSVIYGTDIMVGVGTSKVSLTDKKYKFCSLLGLDDESFGYSYQGFIQHDKKITPYGEKYQLGSLVGVHLNMYSGTLEFYLNRKPLGIAYNNLKNKELYPMVSSTTANSVIKLISSLIVDNNLQLGCLNVICRNPNLTTELCKVPGLKELVKNRYMWLISSDNCNKPLCDIQEKCDSALHSKRLATYVNDNISLSHIKGCIQSFPSTHRKH